jgi:N utilization substance protein B
MAIEEKNINKRSFSRFFAVQILYAYLFNKNENNDILELASFLEEYYVSDEFSKENSEKYKEKINMEFLNELLIGTVEHIEVINVILDKNIQGKYTFDIVDELIKTILRLATFEFNYSNLDKKIIINEYVDIAGEYFDEKAISFVNAILDIISKVEC